jgi:Fe-S cluster assembly scaffold protein SufB
MNSTKVSIENISPRVTKRKYDKLYELLTNRLSRYDVKSGALNTGFFEGSKFDVLVRFIYPKQEHSEYIKDYNNKTEKTVVKYGTRPTESQSLVALRYNSKTSELKVNLSIGENCKFPNDITSTINEIARTGDWTVLNSISVAPKKEGKGLISRIVEFYNKYNT